MSSLAQLLEQLKQHAKRTLAAGRQHAARFLLLLRQVVGQVFQRLAAPRAVPLSFGSTTAEAQAGGELATASVSPAAADRIRRPWTRPVILGLIIVLVVGSSAAGAFFIVVGARQYSHLSALTSDGVKHIRTTASLAAKLKANPLDNQLVPQIRRELLSAQSDFTQIDGQVTAYPGALAALPTVGPLVGAAKELVPVAIEATQAGLIGCDAYELVFPLLSNPLDQAASGITQRTLDTLTADVTQVQSLLAAATTHIDHLSPSDLSVYPSLAGDIAQFQQALPGISQGLQDAQTMLKLAPVLLGVAQPTDYLIEVLDSTELRGSGGFIGNYGLVTVASGHIASMHIQDVDLLDRPFYMNGGFVPLPAPYTWFSSLNPNFNFRDSNLDPDFPTAARYGEQLYAKENGAGQPQGVIAVTPWLIEKLMVLTGPIRVDEYQQTVTADTLVDTIHHYQLGQGHGSDLIPDPPSGSTQRKRFTAYLFDAFFARLQQIVSTDKAELVKVLLDGIASRDLQVYFNAAAAESILSRYHLDAAVQAPAHGDSFFVVNNNIAPNKANDFMTYTAQDDVTIDAHGTATHNTTLSYTWVASQHNLDNDYGNRSVYGGFVQVYVPPKSSLQSASGWTSWNPAQAHGRAVWQGMLTLRYGATQAIHLVWTVPAASTQTASGWQYQLLVQKQAGITWTQKEQVHLPSCAVISGADQGLSQLSSTTATADTPLANDTGFTLSYHC